MQQIERLLMTETVEVLIYNKNSRQYKFSDNEKTLDQVVVTGIAISTEAMDKSFNGNAMLSNVELKKTFINLATPKNELPFKNMPLELIMANTNVFLFIKPTLVDLRKSYIEVPNCQNLVLPVVDGQTKPLAIVVTFTYLEKKEAIGLGYINEE